MIYPPNELTDSRSDPDVRAVLEDFELTHGWKTTRLGAVLQYAAAAAAAAAADDDDDDAAADDDDDAAAISRALLGEQIDMENGLKLIQIRGRYGYGAVFVAWFRRVAGDEWQLPGYRNVYVSGTRRGLSWLAANGPGEDYKLKPPSEVAECIHRLVPLRILNADEKAWAEHMPKPKEWTS